MNFNQPAMSDATVFVLDDEPAVRDSLRCLLETEHYRVETFDSPNQFLRTASARPCACLILDLKMPQVQGLDVLQAVMKWQPQLPTIVLTAYADVPSVVRAIKMGAVNLLEKPCGDEQLLSAVQEALEQGTQWQRQQSSCSELEHRINRLSAREREILNELVGGKNIKQVAQMFGTSPNTVRNQRSSILQKMEAASLADLVRIMFGGRLAGERESKLRTSRPGASGSV